jgi:hypothetical protein
MLALQWGKTVTNPKLGKHQKLIHTLYGTIYVCSIILKNKKINMDTHQYQEDNEVSTNLHLTISCNNLYKK